MMKEVLKFLAQFNQIEILMKRKLIFICQNSINFFFAQIDTINHTSDFILEQMSNEQLVYFSSLPTKGLTPESITYMSSMKIKKRKTLSVLYRFGIIQIKK